MKIVSFGDSFLFGTDLKDSICEPSNWRPSNSTWPALLAQHFHYDYLCCAHPGVGNCFILEEIVRELAEKNSRDLFFCIGWTYIERFDYLGNSNHFIWNTIRPSLDNPLIDEYYYKHLHNELTDKFHSLIWMSQAINLLERSGVGYIMTMVDDLVFDEKFHAPPYIKSLQKIVQPHITKFDNQNFLSWSKHNNFEISENCHPLENAHQSACQYLIDNVWSK